MFDLVIEGFLSSIPICGPIIVICLIILVVQRIIWGNRIKQIGDIPAEDGTVTGFKLLRARDGCGTLRRIVVYLDGKPIGWLPYAAISFFPTTAGTHYVQVRMDWCWSLPVPFTVEQGKIDNFVCGTFFRGWKEFGCFYQMIFQPNKFFVIRRLE